MPSSGFTITSFPQTQAALNANSTYSNYYPDSSGTANTVTVSTGTGIVFAFTAGQMLQIKVANTNTAATTLSVNGTSANLVLPIGAAQLAGGELQAGGIYTVLYDGTNWQLIGAVAYPPTPAEVAAAVSIPFPTYPPGDIRRYGASSTQTAAHNVTYIQAALNANAGYGPVIVPGGTYTLNSRITAPAHTTLVLQNGATLYWSALTATGTPFPAGSKTAMSPGLEVLGDNFNILGMGSIVGIAAGQYAAYEIGIYAQGGSLSTAYTGFHIGPGIEVKNWRDAGILIQFVNDVRVVGCSIHDCGYRGFQNLCGIQSLVHWNAVYNIQPGSINAYGIGHTTDSSHYGGGGRSDPTPSCFAADVASNLVHDVSLWAGIDFHEGFDSRVHHNAVYNACNAIEAGGVPDSSGAKHGGQNIILDHNIANIDQLNGNATTVDITGSAAPLGYVANGGGPTPQTSVSYIVSHSIVNGYGNTGPGDDGSGSPTGFSLESDYMQGAVIDGNDFRAWSGFGIRLFDMDGLVRANHFDAMARSMSGSSCVFADKDTTPVTADIAENKHRLPSGLAAVYGAYIKDSAAPPYLLAANDFDSTTFPLGQGTSSLPTTQLRGQSDATPSVAFSGPSGSVNVAGAGGCPHVCITLTNTSAVSISGITGTKVGQKIFIYASTASAATINDGSTFKLNGGSWSSSQYDTLTLLCVASSGVQFIELMRSHNV